MLAKDCKKFFWFNILVRGNILFVLTNTPKRYSPHFVISVLFTNVFLMCRGSLTIHWNVTKNNQVEKYCIRQIQKKKKKKVLE